MGLPRLGNYTPVISATTKLLYHIPYRLIKSRWLVGTDDLFTVETIHSSRVSNFFFFFEILDLMTIKSKSSNESASWVRVPFIVLVIPLNSTVMISRFKIYVQKQWLNVNHVNGHLS